MSDDDFTVTPNYKLYKPTPNADYDLWGDHLNANADKLDTVISGIAVAGNVSPNQIDAAAFGVQADFVELSGTIGWSGTTVTISGASFTSSDIGKTLIMPCGPGVSVYGPPALVKITGINSPTSCNVDADNPTHPFTGVVNCAGQALPATLTTPGTGPNAVDDQLTMQLGVAGTDFARPVIYKVSQVTATAATVVNAGFGGPPSATVYLRATTGHGRRPLFMGSTDGNGVLTGGLTVVDGGALYQNLANPVNEPLTGDQLKITYPGSWLAGAGQLTLSGALSSGTIQGIIRTGYAVTGSADVGEPAGILNGSTVTNIGTDPHVITFTPAVAGAGTNQDVTFTSNADKFAFDATFANVSTTITATAALPSWVQAATSHPITSLAWSAGVVTVTTTAPHGQTVGATPQLTVAGTVPAGYSKTTTATITGASTFTYPYPRTTTPAPATTPGIYALDQGALISGLGIVGVADPTQTLNVSTFIMAIDGTRTVITISQPTTQATVTTAHLVINPVLTGVVANINFVPLMLKTLERGVYTTMLSAAPYDAWKTVDGMTGSVVGTPVSTGIKVTPTPNALCVGCGTDNAAALDAWATAVRSADAASFAANYTGAGVEAIWRPGNYLSTGSLNLVGMQSESGPFISCRGVVLHSATLFDGTYARIAVDLRASRCYVLDGLQVIGDLYFPPTLGIALGIFDSRMATNAHIRSPATWGCFRFAGITSQSNEQNEIDHPTITNEFVPPTARTPVFGLVIDGWQHWQSYIPCEFGPTGHRSDYTLTPDAQTSFINLRVNGASVMATGGGIPWSIGGTTHLRVDNGYAETTSGPGILFFGRGAVYPYLDIHCEAHTGTGTTAGIQDAIMICACGTDGSGGGLFNAIYRDGAAQTSNAILTYDIEGNFGNPVTGFSARAADISIEGFGGAAAAQVFDWFPTVAMQSVANYSGNITLGSTNYTSYGHLMNRPAVMDGYVRYGSDKQDFDISGFLQADAGTIRGGLSAIGDITTNGNLNTDDGIFIGPAGVISGHFRATSPGTLDLLGPTTLGNDAYLRVNGTLVVTGAMTLPPGSTGAFLPLIGGNMTGVLTSTAAGNAAVISGSGSGISAVVFNSAEGLEQDIKFNAGAVANWTLTRDTGTKAALGNNFGGKFGLAAYTDASAFVGYLWQGTRGSGPVGQGGPYFNIFSPYVISKARATIPGGVVGNDVSFPAAGADVQPVTTLGSNPLSTTSGSAVVNITWTNCGAAGGVFAAGGAECWVNLLGVTATGGITPTGWLKGTRVDNNTFSVTWTSNATSTATGGGAAVTVQPSFASVGEKNYAVMATGANGFPVQFEHLFVAAPSWYQPAVAGTGPKFQQEFRMVYGPPDAAGVGVNTWAVSGTELDLINRGPDTGYQPNLLTAPNTTIGYWVGAWNPGTIPGYATGGGTATNWNTVFGVFGYNGIANYVGYSVQPGGLVGAALDPVGGHGGVAFVAFGSYTPVKTYATTVGTSLVTITTSGAGPAYEQQVNGNSVYIPTVHTFAGVTWGGGTYTIANISANTFQITGTGTAASTSTLAVSEWLAYANRVPYAPMEFQGSYKHGINTVNFRSEDGSIIRTQPGNGIIWDDGTGTASITGAVITPGTLAVTTTGRLRFTGLPTSSAGLVAGTVWNNGGTLCIA